MNNVVFVDTRSEWVQIEDKWAVCFIRCPLYKYCSSHHGMDCKRMGGTEIAKLR
jgi:hypothetical protein